MKTLKDDINQIKKASLHFDLVPLEDDTATPKLDTYFGGKPYITNENELQLCPSCNKHMEFICQLYMPEKRTNIKKLYSFYYCFDCVSEQGEGTYAMNIYTNPSEEKMLKELEYESVVPACDVSFTPAYEIPEWDYCEDSNPEFIRKVESLYGDNAFKAYSQMEQRVNDYFVDTGLKIKGYPDFIEFDDVPVCSRTNSKMEPFIQMESVPELNMNWLGKESCLILFKSAFYDDFALRTMDFEEYDEELLDEDIFEIDDNDDENDII